MSKEQVNRTVWLTIRLTPAEYRSMNKLLQNTMCRSLSEYGRNVLLEKQIVVTHRDKSMDEILEELILLRKELNFIGNNFNQVVRKLNSISGSPDAEHWEAVLTDLRDEIQPLIGGIKDRLDSYSEIWSQKLSAEKA